MHSSPWNPPAGITACWHTWPAKRAFKAFVLNARDVFYARALGTRAKTDGVDAGVIARYLAEHHDQLHPLATGKPLQQRFQTCSHAGRKWHTPIGLAPSALSPMSTNGD